MTATQASPDVHDAPMPGPLTEDDMLKWLWRHFCTHSWYAVPQVTVSMLDTDPSATAPVLADAEAHDELRDRRIDMLVARRSRDPERTGALETMAVEVKVTRADFLADVRHPEKQAPWRTAATRHAYAVPAGLVQPHEVPPGSGLLWLTPPTTAGNLYPEATWVTRAPYVPGHRPQLPLRVWLAMLARTARHEAQVRGWSFGNLGESSPEELRTDLIAMRDALEKATRRAEAAEGKLTAWKAAYSMAAPDGVPCQICGAGIKPLRPGRQWFGSWRHLDRDQDTVCAAIDTTAREAEARDQWDVLPLPDREAALRAAHRFAFDPVVDAEPWRALQRTDPTPIGPDPGDDPT